MSDGLVPWLRAQAAADKTAALAVLGAARLFSNAPQRSTPLGHQVFDGSGIVATHDRTVVLPSDVATHIAIHDPLDVLADCEARLRLLGEFEARDNDVALMLGPDCLRQREWAGLRLAIRLLASGFRHRPGYRQEWGTCPS